MAQNDYLKHGYQPGNRHADYKPGIREDGYQPGNGYQPTSEKNPPQNPPSTGSGAQDK